MKKIAVSILFVTTLVGIKPLVAQDCTSYFPVKTGVVTEMTSYDGKNKATGLSRTTVLSNETTADGYVVKIKSEEFDTKGVLKNNGEYSYSCAGGKFIFSMKNLFDKQNSTAYEGMDVVMDATDIDMPTQPVAGTVLKEGSFTMTVSSNGMQIMKMKTRMYNRKVEAVETITTSAGTFECIKITYDLETDAMFKIVTKGVEWYSKEVGAVKAESYDANGKLLGSSQLTKITR